MSGCLFLENEQSLIIKLHLGLPNSLILPFFISWNTSKRRKTPHQLFCYPQVQFV